MPIRQVIDFTEAATTPSRSIHLAEVHLFAGVPLLLTLTLFAAPAATSAAAAADTAMGLTESVELRVLIDTVLIRGNVRTRERVIRRELLFGAGERLDAATLRESERNLRSLLYLGSARISTRPAATGTDSGATQVLVDVEDLYSRALSPVFSGELDELSYGIVALDYNFLGLGQLARLELRHDPVAGNRGSLTYQVPRFRGSRTALATEIGVGQEGHDVGLSLFQPYYALSTRWTYGVTVFNYEAIQRLYSDRGLAARYEERVGGGGLWVGHSWTRGSVKIRPSFRITASDRRFQTTRSALTYAPAGRRRVLPSAGLTIWRPKYARVRYVRSLGPVEDLQTGSWMALRAGVSHRSLGSDRNYPFFLIQLSPRFQRGDGTFAFLSFRTSTRIREGGYYNLFTATQLSAYVRAASRHTLALRLRLDTVDRPEHETQFLLGVDRGLRGYPPRSLDGGRRFLVNAEFRPTLYARPAWVLAAAVFADGGTAWTPGESSPDLEIALGAGGRLGLPKIYDTPVLRVDLARGLGDGVWQVSFGLGQYF